MKYNTLIQSFLSLVIYSCAPAMAEITITFGGDLNLNPSRSVLNDTGSSKHGKFYTWDEMFQNLAPLIDGQLNFANVETVVSDRELNDTGGTFVFNTHQAGLSYAASLGFNLFSLANNHVGDYGVTGMENTLFWLNHINETQGPIFYSGLAANRQQALQPTLIQIQDRGQIYTIAFLAMTALSNKSAQAQANRPGTLYFRDESDLRDGLAALRNMPAHYKIFSLHYGTEGQVTLNSGQQNTYNDVLEDGDVDLILGHHPHRVRPIEQVGHKLIFYSLGNYQMLGAANIGGSGILKDYGLLGKVHLEWDAQRNKLVAQASEIIALTFVHASATPMDANNGARRVLALNDLSEDELGNTALLYTPNEYGYGVVCLGNNPGPRASAICR